VTSKHLAYALGVAALVGGTALFFGQAAADPPPFTPVAAASNIAALSSKTTATFTAPRSVSRLGSDVLPSNARVHRLGSAGHIWRQSDGNVCVLMVNQAGGCGAMFNKPVLLFLTGLKSPDGTWTTRQLTGIVPNSVASVTIVTGDGGRFPASISSNAFEMELPAGASVAGEEVTLRNGTAFFQKDELKLPN
jgi:hypothetical protein